MSGPWAALVEWLLYQVTGQDRAAQRAHRRHGRGGHRAISTAWTSSRTGTNATTSGLDRRDEADKIQAVLFLLRNFKLFPHGNALGPGHEGQGLLLSGDDLMEAAPGWNISHWTPGSVTWSTGTPTTPWCRRCRTSGGPAPLEQVYLNTGTWRGRYYKATQDDSFIPGRT